MKATILERRATLFVGAPIKVTSDNIPIFITTFSKMGLLPSVNRGVGIKVTPKGIEQEDVISLDMKYLDETVKVSIGPDRIDIVSKKVDENWDTFREFVLKIAKETRTTFNKDIIRYAQCASVRLKLDNNHAQAAYGKLFKSAVDDLPIEWQLRKVIRTKLTSKDGNNELSVNQVYNLSRNNAIVNGENLSNIITLDMDMNSTVGSDINSLNLLQELFFVSTSADMDKAISDYYSVLTDEK